MARRSALVSSGRYAAQASLHGPPERRTVSQRRPPAFRMCTGVSESTVAYDLRGSCPISISASASPRSPSWTSRRSSTARRSLARHSRKGSIRRSSSTAARAGRHLQASHPAVDSAEHHHGAAGRSEAAAVRRRVRSLRAAPVRVSRAAGYGTCYYLAVQSASESTFRRCASLARN
jgi:hypothetical protein